MFGLRLVAAAALAALAFVAPAYAQCDGRWITGPDVSPGVTTDFETQANVYAVTTWDPDGPGPLLPELIMGGNCGFAHGDRINYIGRWDGGRFVQVGGGTSGTVYALTTWLNQSDGGPVADLVAAGSFASAGGQPVNHLARWNGVQWQAIGGGAGVVADTVYAVTTWDPDGPGPQPPQLIVAGNFLTVGAGVPAARIARWDGAQWHALGAGFDKDVRALTTWDPDGPGPLTEQIVAGGSFTASGAQPLGRIARWDGTQWLPLGTGAGSTVKALATIDPDGPGPAGVELIAGGFFLGMGGQAVNCIARWDGIQWRSFGAGMSMQFPVTEGPVVTALTQTDPDGPGPLPPQLVAVGVFTRADGVTVNDIARWDGAQWHAYGAGIPTTAMHPVGPDSVTVWDPDGPGPLPENIVAGGAFFSIAGLEVGGIARWEGSQWRAFGDALSGYAVTLTTWDPDGPGPLPQELVAGGPFNTAGGYSAQHIAAWNGAVWHSLGAGITQGSDMLGLGAWDPDGPGPAPAELAVGGVFTQIGGVSATNVASWTGTAYHAFPITPNSSGATVRSFLDWDPDGPGPQPSELVIGGVFFMRIAGETYNNIAVIRGGVPHPLGSAPGAYSMTTWDPDGPGPLGENLVAGGSTNVARWDGSTWTVLSSFDANVYAVAAWDPDGPGPLPAQLFAGGDFTTTTTVGGTPVAHIAVWDGVHWQQVGNGLDNSVYALTIWDPDGAGPLNPLLVAGGRFTFSGATPLFAVAVWDGAQWQPLGPGLPGEVRALTTLDPDRAGPLPAELIAAQHQNASGGIDRIIRWTPNGIPWIVTGPADASVAAGASAVLSTNPASGYDFDAPLTFQWRRNGVAITDGPGGASAGGGVVSGATGTLSGTQIATLTITAAQPSDAGDYDCIISNGCGSAASNPAALTITAPACPADLNQDGLVDFSDYLEFLNFYDAGDPAADFNQDGLVDFSDYLEFLNHYDAGC